MGSESIEPYTAFEQRINNISYIGEALSILHWDMEITMPEGGAPARSKTMAALQSVLHEKMTDDTLMSLIHEVATESLSVKKQANLREVERQVERSRRIPSELVEELAEETTNANQAWKQAKQERQFERFEPNLARLVELQRDFATEIDPSRDPYAVLVEGYEPYLSMEVIDQTLRELRDFLVPMIQQVSRSDVELNSDLFTGDFDKGTQIALGQEILTALGVDWSRSRLDESVHGFMTGNQFDTRITANFDDDDLFNGISTIIHEGGHALYTLNLPTEHFGTPLGQPRNTVVHESQSRLLENHIGRSKAFFRWLLPVIEGYFPALQGAAPSDAYEYANRVNPNNPIRINADELTYHLHIIIRYEIERDLLRDELQVGEIPEIWNEKYESYLGLTPKHDAEGCLQDIHWSNGMMGYFPTYSLGSIFSAQLFHAMESELDDIDAMVEAGEFTVIHDWLREKVHRHGMLYETDGLVEHATGAPLTANYFTDYIEDKYTELYEL